MSERAGIESVLWPDLERYGSRLSVAFNPSIGRTFLKFSVIDRERFASQSGVKGDLTSLMREAGFSLCANETHTNQARAYGAALRAGGSVEAAEAARREACERIFFYSPTVRFNRERIRTFLPALRDTDMRKMLVSEIKHHDFAYLDTDVAERFIRQQQQLTGAEGGAWYVTPEDQELCALLGQSSHSLHEILEYRDLPPATALGIDFTGDLAKSLVFHPVGVVERAVRRQTIGLDGLPLRAPGGSAAIVGYATRAAAILANGGSEDGIERVELPHAVPVGFSYPDSRLLILKDARYLEYNERALPDPDADLPANAQRHLDFLGRVGEVVDAFNELKADGLLHPTSWSGAEVVADVKARFEGVFASMKAALAPARPSEGFLTAELLAHYGGQRAARFDQFYSADFLAFLADFRTELYNAVQLKDAELSAEAAFHAGMRRVMHGPELAKDPLSKTRREDAGVKIGGARKDFARKALAVAELSTLEEAERAAVVKKENVWPRLDFAKMRSAGVEPHVAHVIRAFRDALPATPYRGGRNRKAVYLERRADEGLSQQRCEWFVRSISVVRDALADVKTEGDLERACVAIHEAGDLLNPAAFSEDACRARKLLGAPGMLYWDPDHWFTDGVGERFLETVLPSVLVNADSGEASCGVRLGWLLDVARATTEGDWQWAIKGSASGDERQVRPVAPRPEPQRPHLDEIRRQGPDFRRGADIDEVRFLETFGFRAIEYGTWLPQGERQVVINHAFDALMDLSEVVGLPPKAMSLGGTLAVAFGARGRGGKEAAAAHYERALKVMNYTRLNGAGCVAHEWGHALDDWLTNATGLSNTMYATELVAKIRTRKASRGPQIPRLVSDLAQLVELSKSVPMSRGEALAANAMISLDEKRVPVHQFMEARIAEWIASVDRLLPEEMQDAEFKAFATAIAAGHWVDRDDFSPLPIRQLVGGPGLIDTLTDALDKYCGSTQWRDRGGRVLGRIIITISVQDRLIKKLEGVRDNFAALRFHYQKNSAFFDDATFYDSHRSKPYWSTDVELFARVFESWVQDRVRSTAGRRSDYLVHGCDACPSAEHSGYPRGEERQRLSSAMSGYFAQHRAELCRLLAIGAERTHSVDTTAAVGEP